MKVPVSIILSTARLQTLKKKLNRLPVTWPKGKMAFIEF